MVADPEPNRSIHSVYGERAVRDTDARRIEISDLLEVQRRVAGIGLQELEILSRQQLDGAGEGPQEAPEFR